MPLSKNWTRSATTMIKSWLEARSAPPYRRKEWHACPNQLSWATYPLYRDFCPAISELIEINFLKKFRTPAKCLVNFMHFLTPENSSLCPITNNCQFSTTNSLLLIWQNKLLSSASVHKNFEDTLYAPSYQWIRHTASRQFCVEWGARERLTPFNH